MIQALGLTSKPRKELPPAVDDVSFEAPAGRITMLLGVPGAGKTTALRLMLELQPGRGITYFRGRPLHSIGHPSREVGVLLGDVPGHPARTVRGHVRMLCAAAGVPVRRGDEVLEAVGLVSLRGERLGTLSRGMDRRLGLACALLGDPHTLVLDEPVRGLSAGENRWLHGMLRAYADQGGTVLSTTADPKEAARTADRVVTLDQGRLVVDQPAVDFSRTRLRPRVAVRTPHAARLSALLAKEARTDRRSVKVAEDGGNRISVYGSTCAEVGETAFRHGIVVHQLADETGVMGPGAGASRTEGPTAPDQGAPPSTAPSPTAATSDAGQPDGPQDSRPADRPSADRPSADRPSADGRAGDEDRVSQSDSSIGLPPPVSVRPVPRPLHPLRYEIRRATGVGTGFLVGAAVLVVSAFTAVLLARIGHTPQPRLLAAWPRELPLPPAAIGAGLLGALAFGDEFRHPALATDRGRAPRRLGLLTVKLLVASAAALVLAVLTIGCDAELLHLVYGRELIEIPADWLPLGASWLGLVIGCAWVGVLAAGVFRSTAAGLATVVAVPLLVGPLVRKLAEGPPVRAAAGTPLRMREVTPLRGSLEGERYLEGALRMIAQPVGGALALSFVVLLCAYLFTSLRNRAR
ncbi:ATP-binding cassette domain-containing protein [Streptomyces hirsutus]|uniref:ATP-binding cassette domain-containing protein n=1 Tax=Streptomyces hirsutus TaxID=35620 RepID=A0ABZ1GVM2_9ACTN|nr:ATP-binding cassette domain-containing protein [Streptomyces hirsutus]WSD09362.1 ATP-binding cassette domain-containing protein [Streptomyces hirsutus]WTD17188.1 ATP-binding cassette domain-containing protein [Streptomyces hirsutus]